MYATTNIIGTTKSVILKNYDKNELSGLSSSNKKAWERVKVSVSQEVDSEFPITQFANKVLNKPIIAEIHFEDGEYLAKTKIFPLYGYGKTKKKAKKRLLNEINSLYNDLMEDDNFSDEFLAYKSFFKKNVL